MNKNIGEFLQITRKAKGLTQKELAERINVSDKTISKWETGGSTPDTSILTELCKALDISVNELISGEKLPQEEYPKKAEENIISLLQENQENQKASKIQYAIGLFLIIVAFLLNFNLLKNANLGWYVDLPTFILLACFCFGVSFANKKKDIKSRLRIVRKSIMPACLVIFSTSLITVLGNLGNLNVLGPNLAVCLLSILYSAITYFILLIIEQRCE